MTGDEGREYLLRLEAVHLDAFLGDTQDLSTVRGGGLALLHAVRRVADAEELRLDPVTTGASTGIFAFRAQDDEAAEDRRRAVEGFLRSEAIPYRTADEPPRNRELPLGHATFVVDVTPATAGFVEDRERLLARNRWRQMASPSLAVPPGPSAEGVCGLTHRLPAAPDLRGPDGKPASRSAYERREYGRAQKQRFYEEVTHESYPTGFSRDFESLASDPERGNLHRKMAVIYLDGNRFGAIQDEHCTDRERQRLFDRRLREHRTELLRKLLAEARDDPGFHEGEGTDGPIRFETLLWGGDELLWVVPAWRGWRTLQRFFDEAASWTVPFPGGEEVPLTHAGGLLFCHHNAPIYRLRELALELAGLAKADRERSLFAYQVLESFDHAAGDLDGFRARRTPTGVSHRDLILKGSRMGRIAGTLEALRPHLPHRQVTALARDPGDAEEAVGRLRAGLPRELHPTLDELVEDLGGRSPCGLHLADLWDYAGVP